MDREHIISIAFDRLREHENDEDYTRYDALYDVTYNLELTIDDYNDLLEALRLL